MKNYSVHADGMSSKNTEQIENTTGIRYRASGNLFIAKQTCRTIPSAFTGVRGDVVSFSAGSGLRMRRYLRECRSDYKHMVTLTYPNEFPTNGTETKNHLRRFLQEVQREDRREENYKGVRQLHSAFWFLEFQERGAPHYHIFLNRCPSKKWVSQKWYDIVNSEDIRHFQAGTRTEKLHSGRAGTISYASKYANKLEQKVAPRWFEKVGRFWGVYGDRMTMSADTFVSRRNNADPNVNVYVEKLTQHVKKLVDKGLGEVVRREEGVLIVVVHDEAQMQKVRRLVSLVSSRTMTMYDLFCDAEVDYGSIYTGESLLYPSKAEEA